MNAEIETCLNTLRGHPRNTEALRSLTELLNQTSSPPDEVFAALDRSLEHHRENYHWEIVVNIIDLQLPRLTDNMRRAELLSLKGRILEDELLDEESAIRAFEEALAYNPEDQATRETLEHIMLVRTNWEGIAARWSEEAEAASERQVATSLFLSTAEVFWRHDPESEKVEDFLKRSLAVEPRNRKASQHLERWLRLKERYQELASLLEERGDVASTPEEKLDALLVAGELWAKELNNPVEAAARYHRALSLNPSDSRALSYLVEALTEQENWEGLIRLYEEALRARLGGDQEPGMLLQIGTLYYRKLEKFEEAEEYFRRVRKTSPSNPVMLDFYREYLRKRNEPSKILALLDAAQRMEADSTTRLKLATEMAQVAEEEVGNLEKAIDIWKGIQRATQNIPKGQGTEDAGTDHIFIEANATLKRLYRQTQPPKWNALREMLKDEIDGLPDDSVDEKIRLLLEVVEIYRDHLKLDVMVINTYNTILSLKPDHDEALEALAAKYEAMGRWNDLITLLTRQKEVQTKTEQQVKTLHQIATIWVERFGNHSQAIKPLEEILQLSPTDDPALSTLREIHTKRRNWREMMEICRLEATHRKGDRRRALYKEMAWLAAEKLGDAREGIQVWNHVLEENPDDQEALAELAPLYRREERWASLGEILHRQAKHAANNPDETIGYLEALGDIYTNRLRATTNAVEVWQQVLELRPESPKALAVLRELFVQEKKWDQLNDMLGQRGAFAELAETLSSAADRSSDKMLKVSLYLRVGEINHTKLNNSERAIKAYERVTAIEIDNYQAAQALVPLYTAGEKWARLLATYEVLLDHTSDLGEQLELLAKIRRLCEEQLGSKHLAFQWCAKAFVLDRDNLDLRAELERLAAETEGWEELVKIYSARVAEMDSEESMASMLRNLASLCIERLHRPEEAEKYYLQLLAIDGEDVQSLEALEQIYTSTQRWRDLAEIYRLRTRMVQPSDLTVEYLFKIAYIQEERLGDPSEAIASLAKVVEIDGGNLRAIKSLQRLYLVLSEWEALVDVLQRELVLISDKEAQAETYFRLGDILKTQLNNEEQAIDAFANVLARDPVHQPSVRGLEEILVQEGPQQEKVARLLQPFYERTEDWEKLAHILELLLEAAEHDHPGRLSLNKRLMSLYGKRLKSASAAFAAGTNILALEPEDSEIRREMTALAEQLDRMDELAGLLVDAIHRLGAGTNPELERILSWELALLLDERLDRPEEAEHYLRRVVELDPSHREAFDTLERILRDTGQWLELRALLEQRKEIADAPATKRDILLQICALNEDVLEDAPAAIRSYEEVLKIEPDHSQATRALERHYAGAQCWEELIQLLRQEMDFASNDEALNELKYRQAEILAHELQTPEEAMDLLEEVVALDPNLQPAVDLLEALMDLDALRLRATEILEPVYQRRENWADLIRVLHVRRLLDTTDRLAAVELLCRIATFHEERLEDINRAFGCYHDAVLLEPGASHIHSAIERLGARLENWEELANAWQGAYAAADQDDIPLRGKMLMRLAKITDENIGDQNRARVTYEKLFELDPSNLETAKPTAEALVRLYEQNANWAELIEILRKQLTWTEESKKRQDILIHISRIQGEVLGDVIRAIETYRELLEENPNSTHALDALEQLYLQGEQWEELVDIYRRRITLVLTTEERRDLRVGIAKIYRDEIRNTDEAIAAFLAVLEEDADDRESLTALAVIYRQKTAWTDLLEMLERQLTLSEEPQEKEALLLEVGTIFHRELFQPSEAISRYQSLLEQDQSHQGARSALEELLEDPDHRQVAGKLLAPIYQAESKWSDLIKIHELQLLDVEGNKKVEILRQIADLYEDGLDAPEKSFAAFRRAIMVGSADELTILELVEQLNRICRVLENWTELVEALEEILPQVMTAEAQVKLHLMAAHIFRNSLHDLEGARRHFQQVLDAEPQNVTALTALDQIYVQLENWESLLEIISRRAEMESDGAAKRQFLLRTAEICRDRLNRPEEAIANYENMLVIFPIDSEAMEALDSLYSQTGRWTDLANLLERRIDGADLETQISLNYRLGQLQAEKLGDHSRAIEAFKQVLTLDPGHKMVVHDLEEYLLEDPSLRVEAAQILEPIYVGRQDWPQLIRIYEIRLEAADDPERRLALVTRIAQLFEEQLEDLEGAFIWYGKVFLEKPSDAKIREQLLRLAGILERWSEIAEIFAQYLSRTLEADQTSRTVAFLLGNIYDERIYDVDSAVACYQRLLNDDHTDSEAFHLLESLLTRAERWNDLLALYEEISDATLDTEERRELLLKRCRVWEEALENLPEAINAYRTILDLKEDDQEAMDALDRLFTETQRWQELCELLQSRCDFVELEEEIIALKYRIGTIYELRIADLPTAIEHYEEVLNRDNQHAGAIGSLERLILDRDQRFRISQVLEPIYHQHDEWAKLVVIYDAQLEFIDDREKRIFLLREIARLHEARNGSLELAIKALIRALEEDLTDVELLEEIERLAEMLDTWDELVQVLVKGVEDIYDFSHVARIQTRIAILQEKHLSNKSAAVEAWRKVLAAEEDDQNAIHALIRLLDELERHQELIEILTRKAEITTEPDARKETLYKIAEIYETLLAQPAMAAEIYRQVLSIDESDLRALNALDRLYLVEGNWMELVWVYRRKLEIIEENDERYNLQLAIAKVYDEKLGDNFEAISSYKGLLDQDPVDDEILDALDRLYQEEKLFSDLLENMELKIRQENDPDQRNHLIYRAGSILEVELNDLEGAVEKYRQVLQGDSSHVEARTALERLVKGAPLRELVAEILENLYTSIGEVKALVEVLELRLEGIAEPLARQEMLIRIAQLNEEGLEEPRRAFAAYIRAMAEEPGNEQVQRELDRLASHLGAVAELVEAYEKLLENIYDISISRQIHLKTAEMLEILLSEDIRALEHYRRALDCGGDELEPLQALDRIMLRQRMWGELLEVLSREVQTVSETAEQGDLYFRIGEIQMSQNSDLDGAFNSLRDALERDPTHALAQDYLEKLLTNDTYRVPVLDVLEPLHEDQGNFNKLIELLETRLLTLMDPTDRTVLLERIALVHEEKLGAKDQALGALGRAMGEEPANIHVLDQLDRLADELMQHQELAALADEILETDLSVDAVRELGLHAARWHGEKLGEIEQAEKCFSKVHQSDPECVEALEGLEKIYRATENNQALTKILWSRSELENHMDLKRGLLIEIARIHEEILDDVGEAINAWRGILDIDRGDESALKALATLYLARGEWEEYLRILEGQVANCDTIEDQIEIKCQAGQILAEEIKDTDRAIRMYREVIDLAPGDLRALTAMETIYTQQEDWAALQEVMTHQLNATEGDQKIAIYLQLAELSNNRLGNIDEALGYYHQILSENPDHLPTVELMEQMFSKTERWYDLVEAYKRHAEILSRQEDTNGEIEQLVLAARITNDRLENPDGAADLLEEILMRDDENVHALAGLARIYESTEQWERCREVLKRAASLNPDPRAAAELEYRLGSVELQETNSQQEAALHFSKALDLDPMHLDAARALEKFSRKEENWEKVAQLMELRAQLADKNERLPILIELGALYADKVDDPGRSAYAYEQARELDPENADVLIPLADAYFAARDFDSAEPLLKQLIDQAGNRRNKKLAQYTYKMGAIEEHRGNAAEAREYFDQAYRIDSTHGPTLVALGRLYIQLEDWDNARRIFRSMLLLNLDEKTCISKAEVFYNLGRAHAALGEKAKAMSMFERGLETAPDHEGLQSALEEAKR